LGSGAGERHGKRADALIWWETDPLIVIGWKHWRLEAGKASVTLVTVIADQPFAAHRGHPPQSSESNPCAMLANKDLSLEFV